MTTLESILVAIGYCLAYGSLVFLASGVMYLLCEGIEYALEVLLDE